MEAQVNMTVHQDTSTALKYIIVPMWAEVYDN